MKTVTLYHLLLSLLLFAAFQPSPLHLPSTVALGAKITNKELRSVHHWSSNSMHINGELVSKVISSYYFLLSNFLFLHKFNFCYLTIIAISSKSSSKSKNVMDLKLDILERIHPYTDKFLFEIGV
ncbi:hypothetical protein Csa_019902 [Cucumis sativus]|nr:hypothetical protein Csa_019902 [Cucumis sativus]